MVSSVKLITDKYRAQLKDKHVGAVSIVMLAVMSRAPPHYPYPYNGKLIIAIS